uniref:Glycosyl transferase family 9 n=1 Tax=Cyanothece sp. (strain PCC 7425 / ATCC 29141) TaxID=395961 RepID=B8HNV6_CYAP4
MNANLQRILFVELLGGIGDLIIALPALQALKRSHPQATLTVLTLAPGGELLLTDPFCDRILYATNGQARSTIETLLSQAQFDLIISDTNYEGIDQIIRSSDAAQTLTNLWQKPPADQRVGDRFLDILLHEKLIDSEAILPPVLCLTDAEKQEAQLIFSQAPSPRIFLYTDAGMPIKRWSTDKLVQLGKALQQQFGAGIVLPIGHNYDEVLEIARQIGGDVQIFSRRSLRQLAAAFTQADLVIAPDTGPARIAAALGVPTITLFGPTWQGRYGQPAPHFNLQGYPACLERNIANFTVQSCWYSGVCPLADWQTCVDDISVDQVMTATSSIFKRSIGEHQHGGKWGN